MNSLKRIFVSIKSQIDHVADEVENHEALASAAIHDLQEIARTTRLHLHRVSNMSAHYQQQSQTLQEQARLWSQRAIKASREDEQKALQCVRRMRQAQQQSGVLEQQYQESTAQEAKIRADLNAIQEQLMKLKNKKEILAARQNRASIQDALSARQDSPVQDAHNIFERWEGAVVSEEFTVPESTGSDSFADQFEREEDELDLKKMLDELTRSAASDDNK